MEADLASLIPTTAGSSSRNDLLAPQEKALTDRGHAEVELPKPPAVEYIAWNVPVRPDSRILSGKSDYCADSSTMHRTARLITLPTLVLFGLAACGSDNTDNPTTTAPTTSVETEAPVVVETETPEATPTPPNSPDYPEREVKPEDEWASNYWAASMMGPTTIGYFDPYEYHNVVEWEPEELDELYTAEITAVCGRDQLYEGVWYLDQPIDNFTGYASEETNLDDVVVSYDRDAANNNLFAVVSIPVTCESWGYIVETYGIDWYISPNNVLLSEEIAYSIVDIDTLAVTLAAENEDDYTSAYANDFRDSDSVQQVYYRFNVPSV